MYENFAFGFDTSHYDYTIKWEDYKNNPPDFVIFKVGGTESFGEPYEDIKFADHVQNAYNTGIKAIGGYWFVNPRYWLEKQQTMSGVENLKDEQHPVLQRIIRSIRNKAISFLAFDVEDATFTTTAGNVTAPWIVFYIRDIVERLQRQMRLGNIQPLKLGVYSRRSIIDEKIKDLDVWLGTQPDLFIWCANWISGQSVTLSASELVKQRPPSSFSARSFGWSPNRPKTWYFWQWAGDSGKIHTCTSHLNNKGIPRAVDLNLFNGTKDELYKYLGIQESSNQEQPPIPQPEDNSQVLGKLEDILKTVREIRSHFS